ncbi:hypothetical protein BDB00DRAFT_835101 [Zychaea mexicana]|uniref:uncharacterized protein n=1 Tax=Zychaea mexicana TaxID=64656 RepID=UPI0022FE3899|nr:uncharacterized protein BDB00DRAFT_835101 [Zychaea mexicana]KAI9491082.1 hypothetical protein BDB00DRAFT_835101 [Zychaea mexicana]
MLQCIKTGVMSPVMTVRKGTLRQQTNEIGDPVSQLHRVAFELAAPAGAAGRGAAGGVHVGGKQYLACINDTVLTTALDPVADTAIWTIIGTDCATYTFWRPDNNNISDKAFPNSTPSTAGGVVTPFPDVQSVTAEGKDRLLLLGNHLTKLLSVYLGDVKCCSLSYSHGSDSIACIIPSVDALAASSACTCLDNGTRRLPIIMVRESDGTAYRTNHFYTF